MYIGLQQINKWRWCASAARRSSSTSRPPGAANARVPPPRRCILLVLYFSCSSLTKLFLQTTPDVPLTRMSRCHFCACRVQRDSQRLQKLTLHRGPSAGAEVVHLCQWHFWRCLTRMLRRPTRRMEKTRTTTTRIANLDMAHCAMRPGTWYSILAQCSLTWSMV